MTLFVLGAGATRGASFVNENDDPSCPPLDGDFFAQLQRIRNHKHQEVIRGVLQDTVSLFGPNFAVSMEVVFTTLEHTIKMIETTEQSRSFTVKQLRAMRSRLIQSLGAVFEESMTQRGLGAKSSRDPKECMHHKKLVEAMQRRDAIISFNYDCLIDYTLKNHGMTKWNARYGYGFNLGSRGKKLEGDGFWCPPGDSATRADTIKLFKLHGSLHFQIDEKSDDIRLKERPYTAQKGSMKFTIIPPEWHKAYDSGVFGNLWARAADTINKSKSIVIIGYSMPLTDLHSTALFRTSVKSRSLTHLVVVNPDPTARRRIRDVFQRGFSPDTRVLSFDRLAHFVAAPREIWDTPTAASESSGGRSKTANDEAAISPPVAAMTEEEKQGVRDSNPN